LSADATLAGPSNGEDASEDEAEGGSHAQQLQQQQAALLGLRRGQPLRLLSARPVQHFTKPPPRFTEASLVKALEELGIGRPSTYASILRVLQVDVSSVHRYHLHVACRTESC
jgi:DNA topoisomerase-1